MRTTTKWGNKTYYTIISSDEPPFPSYFAPGIWPIPNGTTPKSAQNPSKTHQTPPNPTPWVTLGHPTLHRTTRTAAHGLQGRPRSPSRSHRDCLKVPIHVGDVNTWGYCSRDVCVHIYILYIYTYIIYICMCVQDIYIQGMLYVVNKGITNKNWDRIGLLNSGSYLLWTIHQRSRVKIVVAASQWLGLRQSRTWPVFMHFSLYWTLTPM